MRPRLNRSLSIHLRETEDHSRLPFHPACPVCRRDRLAGSLDGEELVSRRTQAAIAAGVLAFSSGGGSAAALASPPDEIAEGTAEVVLGADENSDADFDPGLETAQLPDDASVAPLPVEPTGDGDDISVVEHEPETDTLEAVVDGDLDAATEPAPTAEAPAPPPQAMPIPAAGPAPAPAPVVESAPQEPAEKAGPQPEGGQTRVARGDDAEPNEAPNVASIPAAAPAPRQPVPSAAQTAPAAPTAATPETTMVAYRGATGRAASEARFHTVRPGESLWSIAADLLGEKAGVASIAREVNRLWELNEDRIGTGQPDLLFAGTRLRLR